MKYTEFFYVFVDVDTTSGHRYIYYTPEDVSRLGRTGEYVHHGLGSNILDGVWYTFLRDLEADLQIAQPLNHIVEVNSIYFRGSGRVDDIRDASVPDPATVFLLGSASLIGFARFRRRKFNSR
jgi:hypothetical protein